MFRLNRPLVTSTLGGPGVSGRILAQRTIGVRVCILREITIPAGQATGWHYHDSYLYAYVKRGTLSHFNAAYTSDGVYTAGNFLTETPDAGHVHIGENRGTTDVVLEVLYVPSHGARLSEDAPGPGCEPQ